MPAALVVAGGYGMATMSGWAFWTAGAMVVSGAMAQQARDNGDKKNEANWMAIGAVAGIATSFGTTNAALEGAKTAETAAAAEKYNASQNAVTSAGASTSGATVVPASEKIASFSNANVAAGSGAANASGMTGFEAKYLAMQDNQTKMMMGNMAMQGVTGAVNSYVTAKGNAEMKKLEEQKLDYQKKQTELNYNNLNNLGGITVPTSNIGLPNLFNGAQRRGLLNTPTPTATQVT